MVNQHNERVARGKNNQAGGERHRESSVVQEPEAGNPGQQHRQDADTHRAKGKAVDESVHPKFKLTITCLFSDQRRRDIDGCATTMLDCLVKAVRELR